MNWPSIKNLLLPWLAAETELFGRTDTGRVRSRNEDSFAILTNQSLMMVADGMGGHKAGEVASKRAIEAMINLLSINSLRGVNGNQEGIIHLLISSMRQVNEEVISMGRENDKFSGMGCTFITGYINKNMLYTCHVGDVRAYIGNNEGWRQITTDHTYAAEFEKKNGRTTGGGSNLVGTGPQYSQPGYRLSIKRRPGISLPATLKGRPHSTVFGRSLVHAGR